MRADIVSCHILHIPRRALRRALSGGALVAMLATAVAAQDMPEITAVDLGQSGIALFSMSQQWSAP